MSDIWGNRFEIKTLLLAVWGTPTTRRELSSSRGTRFRVPPGIPLHDPPTKLQRRQGKHHSARQAARGDCRLTARLLLEMKPPFADEAEQKIHRVSLLSKRVSLSGKFPAIEAATGVAEEEEMGRVLAAP
ncbi:MAG: hypothetical protein JO052_18120 [Bradyrhizobium sp.]|nr:hypothetical protein [Bradyrhizobium sp.]